MWVLVITNDNDYFNYISLKQYCVLDLVNKYIN